MILTSESVCCSLGDELTAVPVDKWTYCAFDNETAVSVSQPRACGPGPS